MCVARWAVLATSKIGPWSSRPQLVRSPRRPFLRGLRNGVCSLQSRSSSSTRLTLEALSTLRFPSSDLLAIATMSIDFDLAKLGVFSSPLVLLPDFL